MVRKYKRVNRPSHICSRGPYRRKRDHIEELKRWDCRDYIDMALPDVDELAWADEDNNEEEPMPILEGWAEIDSRNPEYSIFKVDVELKPGHHHTLQMFRGQPFPNTTAKQRNFWWYWICPDCGRWCRYLYALPGSTGIQCRKCWNLPYRSQSKSHAQRDRERIAKWKPYMRSFTTVGFGDWYISKGGRSICHVPPKPPPRCIPEDLLKKFNIEKRKNSGVNKDGHK